jgi:hypothetical protein
MSPGGEFLVGMKWDDPSRGFIYDVNANAMTLLDKTVLTNCTDVTPDKVAIGNHNEGGAKIWENGVTTSLGIEGYVEAITNNKTKIGGFHSTNSATVVKPVVWTKSGTTWNSQYYSTPSDFNGKIVSMSGDGSIAAGWTDVTHQGSRRATIWKSPTEYILAPGFNINDIASHVSDNGKYVALTSGNKAILYVVDENKFIPIEIPHTEVFSSAATSVSNDGLVVGFWNVTFKPGDPRYGFVYSEEIGYYDLGDFFDGFAPGVSTTPFDFHTELYTESLIVSADGKTIAGKSGYTMDTKTWVLLLDNAPAGFPRPTNPTLNVQSHKTVTFSWGAPQTDLEISGYNVYHNDLLVTSTDANVTHYTYDEFVEGTHAYAVAAKYGNDLSSKTNKVYADIYDMALPFFEDFESLNFTANFWKKSPNDNTNLWVIYPLLIPSGIQGQSATFLSSGLPFNSYSLVSKDLKAESNQNVFLKFALMYRILQDPSDQTLYVDARSLDADWQTVKSYSASHLVPSPGVFLNGWTVETINISSIAKGKEFQFRFRVDKNKEEDVLWGIDNVRVDTKARYEEVPVPGNPECINVGNNTADFIWKSPSGSYDLTYYNGTPLYAIGNEGTPFIVANTFTAAQLALYTGKYLTSISAHIRQDYPTNPAHQLNVVVYLDNQLIVDQPIDSYKPNSWNTFALQTSVLIEAGKNLKFGIKVRTHQTDEYPITTDNSYAINAEGNLYSEDNGATWHRISDAGDFFDNLAIIGDITDTDQPTESHRDNDLIGYVMFKDGQPQGNVIYQAKYTDDYVIGVENFNYVLSAYYNNGMESHNSDGSTINIKDLINKNIVNIYPNPATDVINLEGEFSKATLIDITGKIILETKDNRISVSHLSSGIYFLRIESGLQTSVSKVVKR